MVIIIQKTRATNVWPLSPDFYAENQTMRTTFTGVAAILTLVLSSALACGAESSDLRKKADAVRATPSEMSFKKIPWVTDLFEGFRLAKAENRPVFLYMITGDPLDDC